MQNCPSRAQFFPIPRLCSFFMTFISLSSLVALFDDYRRKFGDVSFVSLVFRGKTIKAIGKTVHVGKVGGIRDRDETSHRTGNYCRMEMIFELYHS